MPAFFTHLRTHIFRGLLAIIPILLCFIVIKVLLNVIDLRIINFLNNYMDVRHIPGLGIVILLLVLLTIGYVVTNFMGRHFLKRIDELTTHIPFIREIYILARQIGNVIGKKGSEVYKKTVLVNYPNASQWSIAFLAGKVKNEATGKDLYKVYIPMAHPMTGFIYFVEEKNMIDPNWSIQDGFKMALTYGIVTPNTAMKF